MNVQAGQWQDIMVNREWAYLNVDAPPVCLYNSTCIHPDTVILRVQGVRQKCHANVTMDDSSTK